MELVSRGFGIVPLAFINGAPFPGTVRKRMADWNGISQMFFICRCSAEGRLAELREGVLKAWEKENK